MRTKIVAHCCLDMNKTEVEVDIPDRFVVDSEVDLEGTVFCEAHADVSLFREDQCPGCVGGWQDCPMWNAFAYTGRRDITEHDYSVLEAGICPRRVNGTFGMNNTAGTPVEIHDIDLSAPNVIGGRAFAQGIRDYVAMFHENS